MRYTIYQIKRPTSDSEREIYRKYAFTPLEWVDKVDLNRYTEVWTGKTNDSENVYEILEHLFTVFNINRPENFHGHSLSVSDIIEINNKYYYCDSIGWVEIEFN